MVEMDEVGLGQLSRVKMYGVIFLRWLVGTIFFLTGTNFNGDDDKAIEY